MELLNINADELHRLCLDSSAEVRLKKGLSLTAISVPTPPPPPPDANELDTARLEGSILLLAAADTAVGVNDVNAVENIDILEQSSPTSVSTRKSSLKDTVKDPALSSSRPNSATTRPVDTDITLIAPVGDEVVDLTEIQNSVPIQQQHEKTVYCINGFLPSIKASYQGKSLDSPIEWDGAELSWSEFLEQVIGNRIAIHPLPAPPRSGALCMQSGPSWVCPRSPT
jgi:hypothetical protein